MTPERWQQIKQIYNDTLERKPAQRAVYLHEVCAGDDELRREVESLLAEDETAKDFMESPALEMAAQALAQEQTPSLVGRQIGSYLVLSSLGAGGMGEVYRAKDTELGREVALKVLPPAFLRDPERLARFKQEAHLLASLNHPNIITIYAIEQDWATRYIAMELVEGRTLKEAVAKGLLPIRTVVEVAAQIAAGLAVAHEARIVHRDLKPQNVMIRNDGLVKILDFGLGKVDRSALGKFDPNLPAAAPDTIPGRILGTVDYMSPQQAKGELVDFRSDQFSFGSMLYELVTGKQAFRRETAPQTLSAIIEDEPEPVTAINAKVPLPLQAVIQRCLAKNPNDRYATTAELAAELKELQDNLSEMEGVSWSRLFHAPRPRWQLGLGTLLLAALLAAGISLLTPSLPFRVPGSVQLHALPAEKQLAVLSFTNVGNDPSNQAFSDGLVETLSSKLSQLEQFQRALTVVPASEIRREGVTSAREARQIFGATLVITGSVQRAGDRLRITINLVEPQTLRQLKARSIDTEVRDVSVLQDGVVLAVAELLEVDLPQEAKQVLTAGGTIVPGTYEFYLQARGYLQRYEDVANVDTAIGLFQRTLEQDGQYALAHAGLGEAYWRKYELTKDPQWAERAQASSAQALELNDKLAPVYVLLGMIHTGTGRYEEAVRRVQQALELDPLNPEAYRELARAYEALRRLDEAEATYQKAIAARPSYWGSHNDLGRFYFRLGRYPEAEGEFRRIVELTPDNWRGYNGVGAVYHFQKRYDEAAQMYGKSAAIKPTDTAYSNLGTVYFALGRYAEAARSHERAIQMNDRDSMRWSNLAAAYQWSNEPEKARTAFRRAAELLEGQLRVNPRDATLLMRLADVYSMLDQPQRARTLLREALRLAPEDVANMFRAAVVYEQVGDRERALQWVARAIQGGYSRDLIERSPSLAQLRTDPRFQGLRSP